MAWYSFSMTDLFIVLCAKYLVAVPVVVLLAFLLMGAKRRRHRLFWLSIISLPVAYLIARVAGHLYDNARPFVVEHFVPLIPHIPDNGFPSDHTLIAATIATLVLYFNRTWGIALWIVAIIIGTSRVLAGVHHTVDIVGSMIIAIVSVTLAHYILYYLRREHITYVSK